MRGNAPASVEMMGAVELETSMHRDWCVNVSGQEKPLTNGTKAFQTPGRQNLAQENLSGPSLGGSERGQSLTPYLGMPR